MLIALLLENISENLGLFLAFPNSFCNLKRLSNQINVRKIVKIAIAPVKPARVNNAPPKKKPTPFNVFLEPVNTATHL